MQVTLDVPEELAARLELEGGNLAGLIESGLRMREWTGASNLANEVIRFLARGPEPRELLGFHPSKAAAERASELLNKNREGRLSPREQAELDEMALLDHLMTLIRRGLWSRRKKIIRDSSVNRMNSFERGAQTGQARRPFYPKLETLLPA